MKPSLECVNARATDVARASYGRLLALLASRTGDILAAEDVLEDAFQKALERWPVKGIPNNPEAWLFTVARNRLIDLARKEAPIQQDSLDEILSFDQEPDMFADNRLKLLFVCAHPAIDPKVHTPLMLQTVLGLDAQTIANIFLVSPSSMAQRLVRAKRKIKNAAIPFSVPEANQLSERLDAVLEAIYGAFSVDWMAQATFERRQALSSEALYLSTLLADVLPNQPEALGLAALINFSNGREAARYSSAGELIPLDEQNIDYWDQKLIDQAEEYLKKAHTYQRMGRFQLEAAIQSVHCYRRISGETDWLALVRLYEGLQKIAPTLGAAVGRAVAMGEAFGAKAGLACLDQIDRAAQVSFQPAWASRAHLLALAGDKKKAMAAYNKAISLSSDTAVINFLTNARDNLDYSKTRIIQ